MWSGHINGPSQGKDKSISENDRNLLKKVMTQEKKQKDIYIYISFCFFSCVMTFIFALAWVMNQKYINKNIITDTNFYSFSV